MDESCSVMRRMCHAKKRCARDSVCVSLCESVSLKLCAQRASLCARPRNLRGSLGQCFRCVEWAWRRWREAGARAVGVDAWPAAAPCRPARARAAPARRWPLVAALRLQFSAGTASAARPWLATVALLAPPASRAARKAQGPARRPRSSAARARARRSVVSASCPPAGSRAC